MATTTGSDGERWLINARVVDVATGRVSDGQAIHVRSGQVAAIQSMTAVRDVRDAPEIDLAGRSVLPGMVTCHVHLQGTYPYTTRDPDEPPQRTALRAAARARALRAHGFTTVRSVHELNRADLHVREAASRGWTEAPRIFGAGRALTRPGGHGDGLGAVVADGPGAFGEAAAAELEAGADHVKVFASGGLARAGESMDEPELSLAELRAVVDAARAHGAYVVAHAAGSATIRRGLEAGIRSFEHAYRLDQATAQAMAEVGAFLTPTLVVTHVADWMRAIGFDAAAIQRSMGAAARHVASTRLAFEAGVAIVHGTDLPPDGTTDGTSLAVRELELLVEAGATPLLALQAATRTAARLLGCNTIGEVRIGASADLVAMPDDPIQSVTALRGIDFVMAAGDVVRDQQGGRAWTRV
jgi:imidazolonepropionase-like amidohydrolase